MNRWHLILIPACVLAAAVAPPALAQDSAVLAQEPGTITGTVTLGQSGEPLHGARVLLVQLGRTAVSDENGAYTFTGVPPGSYEIFAVREHLQAVRVQVQVNAGATTTQDFALALEHVHEQVTVTASGRETSVFDSFSTVQVMDSVDLAQNMAGSLGEVLAGQPGVAKRSFGPGSARPIIRGFDNDRVLIMQDGMNTADLSSQSGDHGVTIDPGSLEKVEIIKGPATLLYGNSAIGGVVNTISAQEQLIANPPRELRGAITGDLASANGQAGGNGNFQIGNGELIAWFGGGARRTGDYDSPLGEVINTRSDSRNGRAGAGWSGDHAWISGGFDVEDGSYGIPFVPELAEEGENGETIHVSLDTHREVARGGAGLRMDKGPLESVIATFTRVSYQHDEVENFIATGETEVGTHFDNVTKLGRLELHQRPTNWLSGQLGLWFQDRDYDVAGEEALSPPVLQDSVAGFVYEEIALDDVSFQLGARVERNSYEPGARDEEGPGVPATRDREFTGVSASVGARVPFASGRGAVVANFGSNYRAPALEELYNFGPHPGNLAFEIGNPELGNERSNGGELSLRYNDAGVHGEFNVFYYDLQDYIFPARTGEIEEGLLVVVYEQTDSRYVGFDTAGHVHLTDRLDLAASASYVNAEISDTGEPLPRIPPLSGRVSLDWSPIDRLQVRPEIVLTADQDRIHTGELRTGGYTLANLMASYSWLRGEVMQVFTLKLTNIGDTEYRNHSTLIKDFVPEIGRQLLFTYSMRLF